MNGRLLACLVLSIVTPIAAANAQSGHVVHACISAREGLLSSVPPNSTKQAIWSRDRVVAELNSRKVSSKDRAKVAAVAITTLNPQTVMADALTQGCEYLVTVDMGALPTAPLRTGAPRVNPSIPDDATEQLAPPAAGFCVVQQLPRGEVLDGCGWPCGDCVHQTIENSVTPAKTP